MFTITNKQMEALKQIEIEKFVEKCVVFLKNNFEDWCASKSINEIEYFIYEMLSLGDQYHIKKQINLQKLMFFKIEYDFEMPLKRNLIEKIDELGRNEDYRIKQFNKALSKIKHRRKFDESEYSDDLYWLN